MSLNRLEQVNVRDSSLNLRCESLICNSIITPSTPQKIQSITQTPNATSTVDCGVSPSRYIVITTQNTSFANGSAQTFTFENINILPTSIVLASILSMSSSVAFNGMPVLLVKNITTGSCTISNMNCGETTFTGNLIIYVEIIDTEPY